VWFDLIMRGDVVDPPQSAAGKKLVGQVRREGSANLFEVLRYCPRLPAKPAKKHGGQATRRVNRQAGVLKDGVGLMVARCSGLTRIPQIRFIK